MGPIIPFTVTRNAAPAPGDGQPHSLTVRVDLALVLHSPAQPDDGGSQAAPRARLRLPALPQLRIGRTAG